MNDGRESGQIRKQGKTAKGHKGKEVFQGPWPERKGLIEVRARLSV